MTSQTEPAAESVVPEEQGQAHSVRVLLRNPLVVVSAVVLALIVLGCAFVALLGLPDPDANDLLDVHQLPGAAHLLGTDALGRDVLSRLLHGGQTTLLAAAVAMLVAVALGLPLGLVAGYLGGWIDTGFNWLADLVQSLPGVLALLAVAAVIGPQPIGTMAVFGVLLLPAMSRPVRTVVLDVRGRLYIDAAKVSGLGDGRIIARHVLPVVLPTAIIQAGYIFGIAITVQAGLEVIGVGEAGAASWGGMLNDAFKQTFDAPWLIVPPAGIITLTVLCSVLLASALSDALDRSAPRVRRARVRTVAATRAPVTDVDPEPTGEPSLLTVRHLEVSYPVRGDSPIVDGATFAVDAGEVLGIVGESGSGKTQTVLAALGLLPPGGVVSSGTVSHCGTELTTLSHAQMNAIRGCRIGFVSQEPMSGLDPSFRIGSQLVEPMRVHLKLSRDEARHRALELLARVGIANPRRTFDAFPHQISGGMAQRVLIAGAISCDPVLLIADEPTTALDVTAQAEVLDILRSLKEERNLGIVLVTHDFGVVADICDRVVVMREGRLVEQASAAEVFAGPSHEYTRALLDAHPTASVRRAPARPANLPTLLEVDGLSVRYPGSGRRSADFTALSDVSLTIAAGETLGLVGESGSGKTTLGRAILGLAPVTAGDIRFDDRSIARLGARERRALSDEIQVVFQDPQSSLNPALTVEDILVEPLLVADRNRSADARQRVRELLDAVHLPRDAGSKRASELSGGQRQRVAIARALCRSPRLIVCDEAVSALDMSTQATVLDLLAEIQQLTNVSYLFISHDLDVVRSISHRTAVIHRGTIVEIGDAQRVATDPTDPYTKRLLASAPVPDPVLQAERRARRRMLSSEDAASTCTVAS